MYTILKSIKKRLTWQSRGLFQGTAQTQSWRERNQENSTSTYNGMGQNTGTSTRQIIRPLGDLNNIEQNTEDIFLGNVKN
jgi:hypothetical protein